MFKKIVALITGKKTEVNPQITDAVTQAPSPQAEVLKAAVEEKIADKETPATNAKPKKTGARKKKPQ